MSEETFNISTPTGTPFIEVSTSPGSLSTDIWIGIEDPFSGKTYSAKTVALEFEEIDRAAMVDPTLRLSGRFGYQLLVDLVKKLSKQGIKPDQEARNEGELKATKEHLSSVQYYLQDAQTIVLKSFDTMRKFISDGEPNLTQQDFKMMEFEARAGNAEQQLKMSKKHCRDWEERCARLECRLRYLEKEAEPDVQTND